MILRADLLLLSLATLLATNTSAFSLVSRPPAVVQRTTASTSTTSRSMVAMDIEQQQDAETKKRTRAQRLELASKGLQVHVVGLSIHHASVEVRERLAIPEPLWNDASAEIVGDGSVIAEAAVLSTCNRFEVYYSATDARPALAAITQYLSERSGLPIGVLRQNLFALSADDCVEHLLRVSGGLDSLVVGEGQILSQVRQCYMHASSEEGSGGKVLARLLNTAVSAGKRVRSETAISKGSVSISSAAVELSEMMCDADLKLPFSEARLAVVGAGKMTRLLITHLASRGLEAITIVNRSKERPQELAEQFPDVDVEIKLMDEMWDVIGKADIVFTATSSEVPIIDAELLKEHGVENRKMIVDISVPRNVNEDCKSVTNVAAYNVDDLKAVVAKNTALRQKEMLEAEALLAQEGAAFSAWRESLSAIPTINQLQERANSFREVELKKCTRKLAHLNDKELEAVEHLSRGIVNKLLHGPMAHLRRTKSMEGKQNAVKELSAMFRLDSDEDSSRGSRRRR